VTRSIVGEAGHLVSDGEGGNRRADLLHDTGQVTPLPGREGGRKAFVEESLADLCLARVEPRRLHPHHDLIGTGDRRVHVHHLEDLRPSVL
jgi:hypothetical protein